MQNKGFHLLKHFQLQPQYEELNMASGTEIYLTISHRLFKHFQLQVTI